MERALSLSPGLHLDAKRIAATSVAILVHAAVLMLLLMPTTAREAPAVVETEMTVVPEFKKLPPPPPPPPQETHTVTTRHERAPVPISDPPVNPVDDTRSEIDIFVPPAIEVPSTDFSVGSAVEQFAQIAADIAPVPPYPRQAITRRQAGEVVLRIRVDAQGRPVEVTVESSSGFSLLDEAAVKFVKARWHFVPAMRDGAPVEAMALLPINFTLPR